MYKTAITHYITLNSDRDRLYIRVDHPRLHVDKVFKGLDVKEISGLSVVSTLKTFGNSKCLILAKTAIAASYTHKVK